MKLKIRPCVCGTRIRRVTDSSPKDSNLKTIYVQCPNCGRKGQIEMTRENAIWIWNHTMKQLAGKDNV
jgi:hypothetical protein